MPQILLYLIIAIQNHQISIARTTILYLSMLLGVPGMGVPGVVPPGGIPGFPNMIPTPKEENIIGEYNLDALMGILHSLPPLPLEEPRIRYVCQSTKYNSVHKTRHSLRNG